MCLEITPTKSQARLLGVTGLNKRPTTVIVSYLDRYWDMIRVKHIS